jgi:hypothetical protein
MGPNQFYRRHSIFPVKGQTVQITPYLTADIEQVSKYSVMLAVQAQDGQTFKGDFGTATITVGETEITTTLTPRIGAPFELNNQRGRIVSTDGTTFTVDFNHPLAGKPIVFDLEVAQLTKASDLMKDTIPWMEDYDQGLTTAEKEDKPMVLLLYAAWCNWSKRLQEESLEDPRIKMLKDHFVWVKINSDEEEEYGQIYEQKSFPMIVLLKPHGDVIRKINGFKDARTLKQQLVEVI